jgi:hypothetical protein
MGVSGQRHVSTALYVRRVDPRYPLDKTLGWPRAGLDTEARGKSFVFAGDRTSVV